MRAPGSRPWSWLYIAFVMFLSLLMGEVVFACLAGWLAIQPHMALWERLFFGGIFAAYCIYKVAMWVRLIRYARCWS